MSVSLRLGDPECLVSFVRLGATAPYVDHLLERPEKMLYVLPCHVVQYVYDLDERV
jgi:hypothetical protein